MRIVPFEKFEWSLTSIQTDLEPAAPRPPTLRDSLAFKELQQREATIEDALAGTGQWFLETEEYRAWANSTKAQWKSGLLWLKGNAGTGKSTIVKSAVDAARRSANSTDEIVLSHFFNARGSMLQQSATGMYRTLLVWLLDKLPDEDEHFLEKEYGTYNDDTWAVPQLERILRHAVEMVSDRSIIIFVDALDECTKADVRRMLRVFRDIVKEAWDSTPRRQVRVLFTGRPHPITTFDDAVLMDLGEQQSHYQDIVHYIDSELRIGSDAKAAAVRQALVEKADGLFMWVVLVVDRLNEYHDSGDVDLLQHIKEIPAGLHKLYRYTLDRYPEEGDELRACLRWLLFAKDPALDIGQLWWAMQLSLGRRDDDISVEYENRTAQDLCRYVTRVSKGLVKTTLLSHAFAPGWPIWPECYTVQLVHETVKEFVCTAVELQALFAVDSDSAFWAQSHEHIRDMCFAELIARRPSETTITSEARLDIADLGWTSSESFWSARRIQFPLAVYATRKMVLHAESAQEQGTDQTDFLLAMERCLGPPYLALQPTIVVSRPYLINVLDSQADLLSHHRCQHLLVCLQSWLIADTKARFFPLWNTERLSGAGALSAAITACLSAAAIYAKLGQYDDESLIEVAANAAAPLAAIAICIGNAAFFAKSRQHAFNSVTKIAANVAMLVAAVAIILSTVAMYTKLYRHAFKLDTDIAGDTAILSGAVLESLNHAAMYSQAGLNTFNWFTRIAAGAVVLRVAAAMFRIAAARDTPAGQAG